MKLKRTKTLTSKEVVDISKTLKGLKDGQGRYRFGDKDLLIVKDDKTNEFCAYIKNGANFSFVERITKRQEAGKDYLYFSTEPFIPNGKEIESLPKIPVDAVFADSANVEMGDKLIDIFTQSNFKSNKGAFKQELENVVGRNIKDENDFRRELVQIQIRRVSLDLIQGQLTRSVVRDAMEKTAQVKEPTDKEVEYWADQIAKDVVPNIAKKYGEKSTAIKVIDRDPEFFKTLVKNEVEKVKDALNNKYHPKPKAVQPTRGTIGYDGLVKKADGFVKNNRAIAFDEIKVGLDARFKANEKIFRTAFEHVGKFNKNTNKREITPEDIKGVKEIQFKIGLIENYAIALKDQILEENKQKKNINLSDEEKNNFYNQIREILIDEVITEEDIENLMTRDVEGIESDVKGIAEQFRKDANGILDSLVKFDFDSRVPEAKKMEAISNFVENHPYLKDLKEEIGIDATQDAWRQYFLQAAQDKAGVFTSEMGEISSIHHSDIPTIDAIAKKVENFLSEKKRAEIRAKTVQGLTAHRDPNRATEEENIVDLKKERREKRAKEARKAENKRLFKQILKAGGITVAVVAIAALATAAFTKCDFGGTKPVEPSSKEEQTFSAQDFIETEETKTAVWNALDGRTFKDANENEHQVVSKDDITSVSISGKNKISVQADNSVETQYYTFSNSALGEVKSQEDLNEVIADSKIVLENVVVKDHETGSQGTETYEHDFQNDIYAGLVGEDETVYDGYVDGNKVYILTENNLYEYTLDEGVDATTINDEALVGQCKATTPFVSNNCKQGYINSWVGQGIISQESLDKRMDQAKAKVPGAKTVGIATNVKTGEDGTDKYNTVTLTYVGLDGEGNVVGVYKEESGDRVYFKGEPDESKAIVLTIVNKNGGDLKSLQGASYGSKSGAEVSSDMFAKAKGGK